MSESNASQDVFKLSSNGGTKICWEISRSQLGFDPHSYSLEVATTLMDGMDCLATAACGSGKTGILALLAICVVRFGTEPSLLPSSYRGAGARGRSSKRVSTCFLLFVVLERVGAFTLTMSERWYHQSESWRGWLFGWHTFERCYRHIWIDPTVVMRFIKCQCRRSWCVWPKVAEGRLKEISICFNRW